jgi:D-3-phosphoglycerate dehydrogenase / 2-oxoglutarate reductase
MNNKGRVLFLDTVHECLFEELTKAGFICEWNISSAKNEIEKIIDKYSGIVIRSRFTIDKLFIDNAPNLKFIARSGSGMENIDYEYAKAKGIKCYNSPEGNRDAVGEHATGMILSLINKLNLADKQLKNRIWRREENRGGELSGKTVGIIGFGNTGSAFAQRLSGFNVQILVYDKYKSGFGSELVKEATLQKITDNADIISFHIPLNNETEYFFNTEFLQKMNKKFYLINTSRGKVVDLKSVTDGLKSGKIKGACLDVFEFEDTSFEKVETVLQKPGPDYEATINYLFSSDKVLITPHVAGWTTESYKKLSEFLANKILADFG